MLIVKTHIRVDRVEYLKHLMLPFPHLFRGLGPIRPMSDNII